MLGAAVAQTIARARKQRAQRVQIHGIVEDSWAAGWIAAAGLLALSALIVAALACAGCGGA